MKKTYEAPEVVEMGSVIELTLGGKQAGLLDGQYPAGTPSTVGLFS
ncbi:lasso RiPP family leader peptide-containing protein [Pseudonocardia tropica]|uniref:Lasso RiPP family leader peptide-containing protein n=1 Tax=Pseudonocardia tropica TaxID=681289 RepID=A0ABV1JXJ9_9PSEU